LRIVDHGRLGDFKAQSRIALRDAFHGVFGEISIPDQTA
jgi:hypothetical protein